MHDTQAPPDSSPAPRRASVPAASAGERLDRFWHGLLAAEGLSRSRIGEWIRSGQARIDGVTCRKPARILNAGELLELDAPAPRAGLAPEDGEIRILHEDPDILVLDKPAGLTVHPAPGLAEGTLVHRLLGRYPELAELDEERPGIVHRLDKDTSGLLLVARTESARLSAAKAFADRRIGKVYLAIVFGRPERPRGEIDAPIGRHPTHKTKMAVLPKGGRPARSAYELLWSDREARFSLLAVRIFTGRTHQIRVHMAHIGHPLLGDDVYGPAENRKWRAQAGPLGKLARRQMLHAWSLNFAHPVSGQPMTFVLPPPLDFARLPLLLDRRLLRLGLTGAPGCGKSMLLALFRDSGVPTFSADAAVAALYQRGANGYALLASRYGDRFLTPDRSAVDKTALFAAMRASDAFRREFLAALHPLVEHEAELFFAAQARARLAVAEVPLLHEGGWPERAVVDLTAGLFCPETQRAAWLVVRGWDEPTRAALESWQWSQAAKLSRCSLVLTNPATPEGLRRAAAALLRVLAGLRRGRVRKLRDRLAAIFVAGPAPGSGS